ncbi:hypothetical protein LCGC14_2064350 [marine sediment metagenome]|uniref:Uncharacterized protein n=1 Tax=marine sediment metagenome TaxID=412755 RepID=A0A0F9F7M1_9ZZZZ
MGRPYVYGDWHECVPCRAAREEQEAQEAEEQARNAILAARQDLRRRCGLPRKYWHETFAAWEERGWPRSRAFHKVRRWAQEFPSIPAGYPSLILHSELPGTGKTTLAACAINALINRWEGGPDHPVLPVLYETGPSLNIRVRSTYNIRPDEAPWRETEREMYRNLCWVNLLVLDDVGDPDKEPASDHTRRLYFHIINQRYNDGLPVLLVTNSGGEELEKIMGKYAVDRLSEMTGGDIITVDGKTRKQRFKEGQR